MHSFLQRGADFLSKLVVVASVELIVLQRDLLIVGVHIGAPYRRMGLSQTELGVL